MIRNVDLFTIATSGIQAQAQALNTTGNNIANVNTEGFVRERTNFDAQLTGGVGQGTTERILDTFAQNQLRRDVSRLGEAETFYQKTAQLDDILASEANSISGALSRFYASVQTASDEPTNIAARQLVLGEAEGLLGQIQTLSEFMVDREDELNLELTSNINRANSLIESIAELNEQIRITTGANPRNEPGVLKNERDQAILELAELVAIDTRDIADGVTTVSLRSGQSLVLQGGTFNVFEENGDPDLSFRNLALLADRGTADTADDTTIRLQIDGLGGDIGGLYRFRNEILGQAQRQLGQLTLSFADAVNNQNNLGMDFDGQLGADVFSLPEFQALNYSDNSSAALVVNGRVQDGGFDNITDVDYQIEITAVGAGTVDFEVTLLNPDGSRVTDSSGGPLAPLVFAGETAAAGTFVPIALAGPPQRDEGIEVEFPNGAGYVAGDQFLLQPARRTANFVEVIMNRPEDLALASPIRVDANINNLGSAVVTDTTVTNTQTAAGNDTSAFTGNSPPSTNLIDGPGASPAGAGGVGAPVQIRFTSATDFEVLDGDTPPSVITTVAGAANLNNLLAQAQATAGWTGNYGAALTNYPGYDFSIQGVPRAGDVFDLSYNVGGVDDNRNGLELAGLQNRGSVRRSASDVSVPASNLVSYNEAYAGLVGEIGETTSSADIARQAAVALEAQSRDRFDSTSGVSLDEEAANLVRYQQAYAAAARILSTAQTIFDTLLAAAR